MVIKKAVSSRPVVPEVRLSRQVDQYVANRAYQDVIDLLHQTEHHDSVSQNYLIIRLMQAAQHLCYAALQTQADIEHNIESLKAAELRQCEFDTDIQEIIEMLDVLLNLEDRSSLANTKLRSSVDSPPKLAATSSRWNTILSFLTGKSSPDLQTVLPSAETLIQADYRLEVYTLGMFQVYRNDVLVEAWSSRKGANILKYLLSNRDHPIHKEVLMEQFWPESDAEAQRNNLNVAIYGLRQNLRDAECEFSHVLFQNDCYFLNPELDIWIDADAFKSHYDLALTLEHQGKTLDAITEYAAAEMLYEGCFLPEDLYEDWTDITRQELQMDYLNILNCLSRHYLETSDYAACASMCQKMLVVEPCSEDAHYRLMLCYRRQGQVHLALRQYDRYVKILESELDMPPTADLTVLFDRIRAGESV
jgi:two-component SAPR family response regulator